ncbi:pseudouridine-5'-phosphate glycosidase, partial [uncultured Nitratireductor sp.]|uniref:pseudouridine-5'-phosphate glycosidase n=1 Tax=uncultured Nitratireductor sp. TaxID=520953 RepID=UPI0025D1BAB7
QETRKTLGVDGGMLIANPVPAEDEIPAEEMARHIATAQEEANAKGISGKDVTPFLLGRILELTEGASLATNVALVKNNARLAARIAAAMAAG